MICLFPFPWVPFSPTLSQHQMEHCESEPSSVVLTRSSVKGEPSQLRQQPGAVGRCVLDANVLFVFLLRTTLTDRVYKSRHTGS
jgi:hypothetical protein